MTTTEKIRNQRDAKRRRALSSMGASALLTALAIVATGAFSANAFASPQEGQPPAEAPQTPPEQPAPKPPENPTDDQRRAALEQVGLENASEIPNPVQDPAKQLPSNITSWQEADVENLKH